MIAQKSKSQFASLSQDDRNLILKLCSEREYTEVVEILAKPRSEGGLDIRTSRAALCRYFTQHQADTSFALLSQLAAAANIRHEQNSNAFIGAIRATVQARILDDLHKGKPLADMEKDFRFLKTAENLYLADAKFRAQHPKAVAPAYKTHLQRCADAPEADFVRADDPQPDLASIPPDLSDFDHDLQKTRQRAEETLAALQAAGLTPEDFTKPLSEIDPASIPLVAQLKSRMRPVPPTSQPSTPAPRPSIPPANTTKTRVIPPIPANSTKTCTANPKIVSPHKTNQPASTSPKSQPHIAPPKPGRNDPCPCGSGRKSKKCCHP